MIIEKNTNIKQFVSKSISATVFLNYRSYNIYNVKKRPYLLSKRSLTIKYENIRLLVLKYHSYLDTIIR